MSAMSFPRNVPEVETKDLILREIKTLDAHNYFKICSNKEVMRAYGVKPHVRIKETYDLISFLNEEFKQQNAIKWGIFHKDDPNKIIGDTGFWRLIHVRHRGEVGAKLDKAYWGMGLMSQALEKTIELGFKVLGLNSAVGYVDLNHFMSEKLLLRVGFIKEGLVRSHSYDPFTNSYKDSHLYSIIKTGWEPRVNI